jgi:hypothetical protein
MSLLPRATLHSDSEQGRLTVQQKSTILSYNQNCPLDIRNRTEPFKGEKRKKERNREVK